jgi:hypothetical protein
MALQKNYDYKGINANYWKITNANWNGFINSMYIEMSLYVNEQARTSDVSNFLLTKSFIFENMAEVSREELYERMKDVETNESGDQRKNTNYKFFNDAIDV